MLNFVEMPHVNGLDLAALGEMVEAIGQDPALAKTGIGIDASGLLITESMTAEDMIGWTRGGAGIAEKPADSAFEVTINDTYHAIATVTVQSGIYREYLHLVKTPLGWKILNALYMRVREE